MADAHLPRSRAAVPRLLAEIVAGHVDIQGPDVTIERHLERTLEAIRANGFDPEVELFLVELSDELRSMQSRASDDDRRDGLRQAADVVASYCAVRTGPV